ncbi:MAG: hypothetical protein AAB368_03155, partial [bacterium]
MAPAPARSNVSAGATTNVVPTGSAASLTIAGVAAAADNLLVAQIVKMNGTAAPAGPAGWTRQAFASDATGNFSLTTWTFTVTTSGTYSFTWTKAAADPGGNWGGGLTQYSGVDLSCPVGASNVGNGVTVGGTGNKSTFVLPAVTTGTATAMLVAGYAIDTKNKQFAAAGGWLTRIASRNNTNGTPSSGSSDRTQAVAGGSGTNTVTARTSSANYAASVIELHPSITNGVVLVPATMAFATNQGTSPGGQTFTVGNNHATPGCPNVTYASSVGSFSAG